MSEIILGWPLETKKNSIRKKYKSNETSLRGDLSRAVIYDKEGHLITIAPTGAGKGVSVLIPNLLNYDGPIITIDPKGENFAVTAKFRKETLKQRIFLLDPFEKLKQNILDEIGVERSSLNPLDLINSLGSHMETEMTMVASLFAQGANSNSKTSNSNNGDFWDNEAQKIIVGALGTTLTKAKIENSTPSFQNFIDLLYGDDVVYNFAVILDTIGVKLPSMVYKSIAAFIQKADKERSGVLSTAHSYLNIFMAKSLTHYLNSSSITPFDLLKSDDYTIYIVIPPEKLISHSLLLKLWISTMLSKIMERDGQSKKRTLFLLDECAQLGALDGLRKAITLLRGYGLQVWMFFQDFSQITSLYDTDYKTLINNCGVFQTFGASRNSSAEPIIEIIGKFKPEELTSLDATQQIISMANSEPEILKLFNYRKDAAFKGLFKENPFHNTENKKKGSSIKPFPVNHLKFKF
jgi:type IV secretion system protein VirD4